MPTPDHLRLRTYEPDNLLWPFVGLLQRHLERGRYHETRQRKYVAATLHFGTWLRSKRIAADRINEAMLEQFLDDHEGGCPCVRKTRTSTTVMRSGLNNLLRVLREHDVIPLPALSSVGIEVARLDGMLDQVWGLSPDTRRQRRNVARRLLDGAPDGGLTPSYLRAFVLGPDGRKPATIRSLAAAVRCYLRFRSLKGEDVRHLARAIPTPSFKPAPYLPIGLAPTELDQLLAASALEGRRCKRAHAIVRCLADLGMRSREVTRLTLDDIDWAAGIIRVPSGKARRCDVMPLPAATGEAIADYLVNERPQTDRRQVFVRHNAPIGEPIGRRAVQRSVQNVYRRLGWDETKIHILRHTIASKLVNDAVPMKQVADVMRHRSVVTTAGYARVDQNRLSAVALPWPGANS
ncbi:MAG: integrase [Mesorhizobium sp.]|nr:MAG: integrase [Mesorhizobium sp.]